MRSGRSLIILNHYSEAVPFEIPIEYTAAFLSLRITVQHYYTVELHLTRRATLDSETLPPYNRLTCRATSTIHVSSLSLSLHEHAQSMLLLTDSYGGFAPHRGLEYVNICKYLEYVI